MPPIRVYTQSPINAAKASGVTPQTSAPVLDEKSAAGLNPTPASAAPASGIGRYAPAQPTPTQKLSGDGPAPPQPGAVPHLPAVTATASASSGLPPPPRAGESYQPPPPPPPATTQAPQFPPPAGYPSYPPPQMAIPPPAAPYLQRGTATATRPATTTQGSPPLSYLPNYQQQQRDEGRFTHPPGYQQDVNASDFATQQRGQGGSDQRYGGLPTSSSSVNDGYDDGDDSGGVWSSAMKWAGAAGQKLSAAETEVWKRINKQ
ncbi:hypothetical protein B0H63DRAFT_481217 [Podospora didyma]|uniref:Uncharacterized protein n=1 Tax=Podospora didyma TaxID=330526 RepID=A0AAE0KDV0_9PEZI|nr:hypothetical protein B0H63DRAFT_481217 [Podospora didyma]